MEDSDKRLIKKLAHYGKENISITLKLKSNHKTDINGYVEKINRFGLFGSKPSVVVNSMLIFLDEIDGHTVMPETMKLTLIGSDARRTSIGLKKRIFVLERDDYTCVKCGRKTNEGRLEVDHIIPVSKGGTDELNNLQTLCFECNRGKGGTEL